MEDDVCLDVLVSWLAGRLFNFFIWDSTMLFFPFKLGRDPTLTKLIYFSIFLLPQPELRLKMLIVSSLLNKYLASAECHSTVAPLVILVS